MATLHGEILEATDPPIVGAQTLALLKARFWDPLNSSLKIPHGDGTFTIGQDVLSGLPDATLIVLQFKFEPA